MIDNDNIYEDTKRWKSFTGGEEGDIWVYARCPKCGRFIKGGEVFTNGFGDVILKEWVCKKHGDVEPCYIRE